MSTIPNSQALGQPTYAGPPGAPPGWLQLGSVFGDIRLTVERVDGQPVFIGMAREDAATAYLTELAHDEVSRISGGTVT